MRPSHTTSRSPSEQLALQSFTNRAVFTSDSSMFTDLGTLSDHPITFGDNQLLLSNSIGWLTSGPSGLLAIGDNGSGFEIGSLNSVVAPFGVSYSGSPTNASGHIVGGILPHPITAGVSRLGVDFQLPLTIIGPAIDLTSGGGSFNVLAAFVVPEPSTGLLLGSGLIALAARRRLRSGGARTSV